MSLVMNACPRCYGETADVEHTEEDCAEQQRQNAVESAKARANNDAWRQELKRRRAAGEPEPKRIVFPDGRVITPANTKKE